MKLCDILRNICRFTFSKRRGCFCSAFYLSSLFFMNSGIIWSLESVIILLQTFLPFWRVASCLACPFCTISHIGYMCKSCSLHGMGLERLYFRNHVNALWKKDGYFWTIHGQCFAAKRRHFQKEKKLVKRGHFDRWWVHGGGRGGQHLPCPCTISTVAADGWELITGLAAFTQTLRRSI